MQPPWRIVSPPIPEGSVPDWRESVRGEGHRGDDTGRRAAEDRPGGSSSGVSSSAAVGENSEKRPCTNRKKARAPGDLNCFVGCVSML